MIGAPPLGDREIRAQNQRLCQSIAIMRVEDLMSAINRFCLRGCALTGAVVVFVLASGAGAASSEPWPQWRGPNRDNVSTETGLLKKWPQGGPPLAWRARNLGAGYSGVSVAGGKIFTMGDGPDACYLIALDLSGKELWRAKVGPTGGGGGYPGPRSTPTFDGAHVYALGQFGDLVCVDTDSGQERWHKNLARDFHGAMMSGWGYAESVLVDGQKVICTPGGRDGTMAALNKETGEPVWRSTQLTDPAAYASPIAVQIANRKQYVQLTGESVSGVDADSGKLLWRADRQGRTAVIPTPVSGDDEVFVTSGYNVGCNLFRITAAGDKFKATEVYANKDMKVHHGGVVLVGDYIYGSSDPGILTCMEFKTGKVKWKDRSIGKGSLTYADGHLYLRAEGSGAVALIEATPDGYHETSEFTQPDRSNQHAWPHPVIADGKLYLRDQDLLFCYDVKEKQ